MCVINSPQQQWSLMPTHGVFSTVAPSYYAHGGYGGQIISFTSWLGMNSKQGKLSRYVKELQSHMRLRASGDRHEIRQSYVPVLWNRLGKRLQEGGKEAIAEVIELMDDYFLTRDDFDAIIELGVGPMAEGTLQIPTLVKGRFTKEYNGMAHPMPFIKASSFTASAAKVKKEVPDLEEAIEESDDETLADEVETKDDDAEDDVSKDKYVKAKKPKKTAAKKGAEMVKKATVRAATAKAKGKGKRKADEYDDEDDEEEEEVRPGPSRRASAKGGKVASLKRRTTR